MNVKYANQLLHGSLTDIVEMDAASNNSVEDIRSIREEVNFLPTIAKYRVYIIDEVHMLSTGAFNALLKTLEEPPSHVKFILATTEPQKLPATILSRCQRFDFKKIGPENVEKRLKYVCDESKIEITSEALKLIAILSEGAMRDALSILERCVQEGADKIDEDKIKDLVGIPKLNFIVKVVKSVFQNDVDGAINAVNEILDDGKDLNNLLWETIKYVKDILVYKSSGKLQIYNEEEIKQIDELSKLVTKEKLLFIIYDLSELENEMKWSSQKSILFQVEIIKLCCEETYHKNVESVDNGSSNQTKTANNSAKMAGTNSNIGASFGNTQNNVQQVTKNQKNSMPGTTLEPQINGKPVQAWNKIVGELKQTGKILLYTNLLNSKAIEINDMTVGIDFPNGVNPFVKSIFEKQENVNELSKLVSMEYGKEMRVKIIDKNDANFAKTFANPIENIAENLDIPINIIDE